MKNGKAAGPSGVVQEMVKAAGKAGVDIITGLANQIIIQGAVPAKWELSNIVNCYRGETILKKEKTIGDCIKKTSL